MSTLTETNTSLKIPSVIFKPVSGSQAPIMSQKIENVNWNLGNEPTKFKRKVPPSETNTQIVTTTNTNDKCSTKATCNDAAFNRSIRLATWVWVIVIPIIVFLTLVYLAPSFVTTVNPNEPVIINYGAIVLWTIIISIIIWVSIYAFNGCCSLQDKI